MKQFKILSLHCTIFLLLASGISFTQDLFLQNLNVDNGLPSPDIKCLLQDQSGYLWIATSNGLARYNGFEFKIIDQRDGIANQEINTIFRDHDYNLWIGHVSGAISKITNNEISVCLNSDKVNNKKITKFQQDSIGNIWFSTFGRGLFYFNPAKKESIFNTFSFNDENENSKYINDFRITDNHKLIIVSNNGLYLITDIFTKDDAECISFTTQNSALKNDTLTSIIKKSKNEYILGSLNGLYLLKLGNKVKISLLKKSKNKEDPFIIKSLTIDNDEIIWGNSHKDIFSFDGTKYTFYKPFNKYINIILNTLFIDSENNLWFGTSKGLFKYLNKEFLFFTRPEFKNIKARHLLTDNANTIWIGTNKGILKLNENDILNDKPEVLLANKEISFLYQDSRNNIWIGIKNKAQLYLYERVRGKLISYNQKDGYNFNGCSSIIEDQNNNIWFTSIKDTGIVFYNYPKIRYRRNRIYKGSFKNTLPNLNIPKDEYSITFKDKQNQIWIVAKHSGLMLWNGKEIHYFEKNREISNQGINSIVSDHQDNVWIATAKNGLYKYNGVFFKNIGLSEGLGTKNVLSLASDNYDNIWLTTKNGLHKYDQYSGIFVHYNSQDYFHYSETNSAITINQNGLIWLFSQNGLTQINPDISVQDDSYPQNIIERILLFNKAFNYSDYSEKVDSKTGLPEKLKLPFNINHISFEFTAIKFNKLRDIEFQYKLNNFDKEWYQAKTNRVVQYTNLQPGNYSFQLRSSDKAGIWSEPLDFRFKIKAPVYKQIWFYIIILLSFSLVIYIIILFRVRYFKRINIKLKENYADRTKQLSSAYSNIESNIKYAKNIQNAILRNETDLSKIFPQSFVFSKPKESTGGDFFWYSRKSRKIYIAVGDCIGHGVQGAFMSLIGHNLLNQTINEIDSFDPPFILEEVSRSFNRAIKNTKLEVEENNDMDISFCRIDKDRSEIIFSAANSSAYFIQDNKLTELKGNRRAIGQDNEVITQFSRTKMKYKAGDVLFMFTNGFADQFGGPENKRFRSTRLKNLLVNIHDLPIEQQKDQITKAFENWKEKSEQIDDILILGIRL